VRQPAAGVGCPANIDSGITLLYKLDLPFLVDDEAGSVGDAPIGHEHSVGRGGLAVDEIAEEGERKVKLLGEFNQGRGIIATDSQDLRVSRVVL
jgi:hypothetical protein